MTIAAYHPGLVTTDSIAQYEQALRDAYTDAHPPLMAWLWSGLLRVVPGASGLLWLHAALLWLGLYLVADGAALRGVRHAWLVVAVGFLPPILGTAGEIWKDVGMAAALVCAAGIVHRAGSPPRGPGDDPRHPRGIGPLAAALALLPLFYATAVRANAPAASGPILVYWAMAVWPRLGWRRAAAVAAGVVALFLLAQWGLEARVIGAKRTHFAQQLETFDLVAIRCAGGDAGIPGIFLHANAREDALCASFDPTRVDSLYSLATSPLRQDTDRTGLRDLAREWRRAVLANPGAYLAHRATVFAAVLGFGVSDASRSIWIPFSVANPYGLDYTYNRAAAAIGASVAVAAALGLYNGVPWLALALGVAVAGLRRRDRARAVETWLALSALGYVLAYVVVGIASDYRYLYWTVVASAVAGVLAVLQTRRFAALAEGCARFAARIGSTAMSDRGLAGALAAIGFTVTVAAFYPGVMTVDSIYQYDQATGLKPVTDHHPAVMVWLWRGLALVAPGPAPMLVLHAAMMWAALAMIAATAARRGVRHAWLVTIAGFTPMFLSVEGAIWKDVGMAAAFLLATAMLDRWGAQRTIGVGRGTAVALPLFYASVVRANAPAAALPLLVYAMRRVRARGGLGIAVALGSVALVACLALQWALDRAFDVERVHFTQYIEAFDLAGIQCAGGEAPVPLAFVRTVPGAQPLCKRFDPVQVDYLFSVGPASPLWASDDPDALRALGVAWRRAVVANPGLYLAHRARAFNATMGAGMSGERRMLALTDSLGGARGFAFAPNVASTAIAALAYVAADFHFYNGYAWLAIAFVVAAMTMRRLRAGRGDDTDQVALALAGSAIAYTLPYFFVGVAPDYRYLYWTVVATLVAAILVALPRATPAAVSR